MRALLVCLCIIWSTVSATSEEFLLSPPAQEGPVLVQSHFALNTLNKINDEEDTFEFSGVLTLKWNDPRLTFDPSAVGVSEKIYQGTYQFNEIATGWYPQLFLVNESGLFEINGVTLRILPDGSSTLTQTINATAEVYLDMRKFPFDQQQLQAIFQVVGLSADEVELQVESDNIDQANTLFPLPQWSIGEINTFIASGSFVVDIDVERKPFYIIRLVVIPLIVIVLLSFSVFWMDRSSLGDRLNISFIGILTGVAYLLVTSDYLPKISYFTLIHGFLNLSYIMMCATVVINLVVGSLDKQGRSDTGDKVDLLCRWIFPLVYFGLLIVMFAVASIIY